MNNKLYKNYHALFMCACPSTGSVPKICLWIACFFFLSCKDRVTILGPEEPDPTPTTEESPSPSCLKKTINGQDICVQKREETFYLDQMEEKTVDFLFILDVSASMTEVLKRLGQAFEPLMSFLQQTQWRMFFTTADHGDHSYTEDPVTGQKTFSQQSWQNYQGLNPYFGQFMNLEYKGQKKEDLFLSAHTPDYKQVFKDTLTRKPGDSCALAPYCQGAMEQPLRVLKACLERWAKLPTDSPLKLQESSTLISFIVTNEDERKEDPTQATTAKEVHDRFKELFPHKAFYSFSLLIQDDTSQAGQNCLKQQMNPSPHTQYSVAPGLKVAELAQLTKGKNISLCEEDYGPPLEQISRLLSHRIQSWPLKETPLADSLEVTFTKNPDEKIKWRQEGQKLIFEELPPSHAEIKVTYFVQKKEPPLKK